MVGKYFIRYYMGLLAYSIMVYPGYQSNVHEFWWLYSIDNRLFVSILMDTRYFREQTIFWFVYPWCRKCIYSIYATFNNAAGFASTTILDLGNFNVCDGCDYHGFSEEKGSMKHGANKSAGLKGT